MRMFKTIMMGLMALLVSTSPSHAQNQQTAILAGGCFWCLESDVDKLDGVLDAVSGYSGGTIPNPSYQNYNDDIAGYQPHVEVVQITYDADQLSYESLLDYYFRHIDPTDNKGQFCDRGASYRPVIYTQNDAQRRAAQEASKRAEDVIGETIRVEILPATQFWPAEGYHQNYAQTNTTKYKFYRWRCGRDARIKELWGDHGPQGPVSKRSYN